MNLEFAFKIGQFVYLITDPEQNARIITGYKIRRTVIYYLTTYIGDEMQCEDFELTTEKTFK